jgi:hypothetical protein
MMPTACARHLPGRKHCAGLPRQSPVRPDRYERVRGAPLLTRSRSALPLLGDILTAAPARLQQQLYQAFDLQIHYESGKHQVSIHAVITPPPP